jgi:hypothetical protein
MPERVAMKDTGHKTQSVLDRYHILGPLDLQEMARKLTGIIGQTGIDTNGVTLGMSLVVQRVSSMPLILIEAPSSAYHHDMLALGTQPQEEEETS